MVEHSSYSENPLVVTLSLPERIKVRVYFYYSDEEIISGKITLSYLEKDSERETYFDYSDVNFVMAIGFIHDEDVFVIWDTSKHKDLALSRKLKIDSAAVISTYVVPIAQTEVNAPLGKEIILLAKSVHLLEAINKRIELTITGLVQGDI